MEGWIRGIARYAAGPREIPRPISLKVGAAS